MPDPIIIVGAGPTGLSLAYALALAGLPVLVLEAEPALVEDLRGSTFHPSTLDLLDPLAVTAELIAGGVIAPTVQFRDRADWSLVAEFDFGLLKDDTAHPYRLQCEQWKLTRALAARLAPLPHAGIRYGCRVEAATQDSDGVTVACRCDGQAERLRGAWLVGCDGVPSVVRSIAGIAYEGFVFPEKFFSISTPYPFRDDMPDLSLVTYIADPVEWSFLLRAPDFWRVMFPIPPQEPDEETAAEPVVQRRLQALYAIDGAYEVAHRTIYRVQQRVAATYNRGRILLAGDAAHANNPLGGMGLNSGVHDALNLAEKLAAVWRGEAGAEVLDRYTRQRRHVSTAFVNAQSQRNKEMLEARDPAARRAYLDGLSRTAEDPGAAYRWLLSASLIDSLRTAATLP